MLRLLQFLVQCVKLRLSSHQFLHIVGNGILAVLHGSEEVSATVQLLLQILQTLSCHPFRRLIEMIFPDPLQLPHQGMIGSSGEETAHGEEDADAGQQGSAEEQGGYRVLRAADPLDAVVSAEQQENSKQQREQQQREAENESQRPVIAGQVLIRLRF